jgi:hypothetical protein
MNCSVCSTKSGSFSFRFHIFVCVSLFNDAFHNLWRRMFGRQRIIYWKGSRHLPEVTEKITKNDRPNNMSSGLESNRAPAEHIRRVSAWTSLLSSFSSHHYHYNRLFVDPIRLIAWFISFSMALQHFCWTWPVFQFLNPTYIWYDSLDGRSARRKAATYTQNNTNTD